MFTKSRLRIYFWIFVLVLAFAIYWHKHENQIRDAKQRPYGDHQVAIIENLIQNAWVQVWKATITPGEPAHYHRNETPRVLIPLKGGQLKLVDSSGNIEYLDLPTGQAVWVDLDSPGKEHMSIVVGSQPIETVVIEIRPEIVQAVEFYQQHVHAAE
ncbi:MAG: hypothetical protein B7X06_00425 [Verrucomicrobia bacterium 21-51-4]|nr:MAG: hypothetical protein B7X06_00425 [Verrucomicrobia bacterium 21-51-4]HQU08528.1 hypothetical protein [Opitutales bacterium]